MVHIDCPSVQEEIYSEVHQDRLNALNSFKTSAEVIMNVSSSCSKFLSGKVGTNDKFSFVKPLTKKSFKTSAYLFLNKLKFRLPSLSYKLWL